MKIVLYDDYKVGLLKDGNVVDVSEVVPRGATPQLTIEGLITNFQALRSALDRALVHVDVLDAPERRDAYGGEGRRIFERRFSDRRMVEETLRVLEET